MQNPKTSGSGESPAKKQLLPSEGRCGKTLVGYQDAAFDIRKLKEEELQDYPNTCEKYKEMFAGNIVLLLCLLLCLLSNFAQVFSVSTALRRDFSK